MNGRRNDVDQDESQEVEDANGNAQQDRQANQVKQVG